MTPTREFWYAKITFFLFSSSTSSFLSIMFFVCNQICPKIFIWKNHHFMLVCVNFFKMTRVAPNYVQINTYDVIHIYPPQRNISAVCLQNVVTMMLQYFALPFCCFSKEPKWWLYVRHPFNFPPLLRACYISNQQVPSVTTFVFILFFLSSLFVDQSI